mmetsp:Transcript_24968/g.31157  ORF Transcript_24968/g.31157 Transcript_24968/m.31157 type:complete len:203 (+) Transcript_24968:813-1421(+)
MWRSRLRTSSKRILISCTPKKSTKPRSMRTRFWASVPQTMTMVVRLPSRDAVGKTSLRSKKSFSTAKESTLATTSRISTRISTVRRWRVAGAEVVVAGEVSAAGATTVAAAEAAAVVEALTAQTPLTGSSRKAALRTRQRQRRNQVTQQRVATLMVRPLTRKSLRSSTSSFTSTSFSAIRKVISKGRHSLLLRHNNTRCTTL